MFEDQYVELLPARTTMKCPKPRRRGGSVNFGGNGGSGGPGTGGGGGAGGTNLGVQVPIQVNLLTFGDNTNGAAQYADGGRGGNGTGGAGGAGGSAG
jgi:hypothetical protein